jgi:hypothetical protein
MKNAGFTAGLVAVLVISTPSFAADDAITLPAGNELHVQLITTLSSKTNDAGDLWTGKVVEPIFGKGGEIVPDGSTVDGHITYVKGSERGKGKGEMRLVADSISTPDSSKYNIMASPETALAALAPHKKGKNIEVAQGTEITFVISRDTTAKKVPVSSN